MKVIKEAFEFEWDKGNIGKNIKHKVEDKEAEEVFFDKKRFIFKDKIHSGNEERFRIINKFESSAFKQSFQASLIGKTKRKRLLFVVFTKRNRKVRIISARDINKKEVKLYEEKVGFAKI